MRQTVTYTTSHKLGAGWKNPFLTQTQPGTKSQCEPDRILKVEVSLQEYEKWSKTIFVSFQRLKMIFCPRHYLRVFESQESTYHNTFHTNIILSGQRKSVSVCACICMWVYTHTHGESETWIVISQLRSDKWITGSRSLVTHCTGGDQTWPMLMQNSQSVKC